MADTDLETPETVQSPGATLADQMYATPEVTETETPTEEVVAKPEDETPAEGEVETTTTVDDEPTEIVASEEDNPNEIEVTTLEQLAEHLETDPDWIRGLSVTEKVNGHEVEVSLSDALRTHRQVAAGDEYLADAKAKSKQMLESSGQDKQLVAGAAATLNALLTEAEAAINNDMSDTDWAKLRRDDPAEYSARKEEVRERRARIGDMRSRAMASFAETGTKMNESNLAAREQNLPQERAVFLELVPEWNDPDVVAKESGEITEYLKSRGHTPDEIEMAAYNGKLLAYVRNSMMYERSKGKIDAAKKKVVNIPKILKPGKSAEGAKPKAGGDDAVSILYG